MRSAVVLSLTLLLGVALGDIASTNPEGQPFFNPSVVRQLALGETITSTLSNQTDYAEFYYVWIPNYVGQVSYYFNNTNYGYEDGQCYTTIYAQVALSKAGDIKSFPCEVGGADSDGCDSYDFELYSSYYDDSEDVTMYSDDLRPGNYHYITVYPSYNGYYCPYVLNVNATLVCDNTSVPIFDSNTASCANFTNVTSNGGILVSSLAAGSDDFKVFGLQVPNYVTRVWAYVSSPTSDLEVYLSQRFSTLYYYRSDDYTYSGYHNTTLGVYNYFVELEQPEPGWIYFTVAPDSSLDVSYQFNISVYWNNCGSTLSGLGDYSSDTYDAVNEYSIADCSDPVTLSLNITTQSAWTFNVPNYNYSLDYDYGAVYASLYVPWGTTGYINLTCNSTDTYSYAFVVFTRGANSDCSNSGYDSYITCSYVGGTYYNYYNLISQDLFTGGWWSIGVCNGNSQNATTVVITNNGIVAAPASPSPSVTPSPGAGVSPSSSPGADTGGDTGGNSSSDSFGVIPAFVFVALAALFAFLF